MATTDVEVLIAGAGPTGLLLALLLAQEGVKFRIIDENQGRAKESRAMAIQPRTLELLQNLGLVNKFLEQGIPARGLSVFLKGRKYVHLDFDDIGRDDTPFPYLFFLPQSNTEQILEEALAAHGIHVERQTALLGFEDSGAEVSVKIKHADKKEEVAVVKYLVGCDGARSQVRKSAGLGFAGGTYHAEFLLADAKVEWNLPHDRIMVFMSDQVLGLFMPIKGTGNDRVIVIGQQPASEEEIANVVTKGETTIEEIQQGFREATQSDVRLLNPAWVTRYRSHHRSVERMKVGRVFVAGDAAHIHSPAGGQGMNTGLQDAANLAWKISLVLKGEAPEELLKTYNDERFPIAQKLLNFTDRFFNFVVALSQTQKFLRNLFFPPVAKIIFGSLKGRKFLFGFVSQLNIHYHANKFVSERLKEQDRSKRIHAGCRAPDASYKGSSLFEMMKGYHFHLLVMSCNEISEEIRRDFEQKWRSQKLVGSSAKILWIDPTNSPVALERYQVDDILVSLVRPDGYIAYQQDYL